ncbi:MerR family transcriptional regulator [Rhodobacteraceae bacterium LMO-12]|nr:MerR family transcriptional regulator [Rhodobacteraceae bacterium LMO-JJ12]
MAKSAEAFRTISEVADWLGSPAHVLRFWESKFSQVKPVKRAGGRRYYRPADMLLLGGIKKLLHDDGMTIKGVQKILREQGVKHVSDLSAPLEDNTSDSATIEGRANEVAASQYDTPDSAQVLQFQREETARDTPLPEHAPETSTTQADAHLDSPESTSAPETTPETPIAEDVAENTTTLTGDDGTDDAQEPLIAESENTQPPPDASLTDPSEDVSAADTTVLEDFAAPDIAETGETEDAAAESEDQPNDEPTTSDPSTVAGSEEDRLTDIPAFLYRSTRNSPQETPVETTATGGTDATTDADAHAEIEAESAPTPPRPAIIQLPPDPADDAIDAPPGLLKALAARRGYPLQGAARAAAIIQRDKLSALLSRQHDPRRD